MSGRVGDPHGEVDHPVAGCPVEITLRGMLEALWAWGAAEGSGGGGQETVRSGTTR